MNNLVYLALGTNQGDKTQNLTKAIDRLNTLGAIIAQSSFIETKPLGFVSSSMFLNAVVCLETNLSALELLQQTQEIERQLGRKSKSINQIYSDRTIDIDILFFNDEVIQSKDLTIPHKEIAYRLFVLQPLNEIAPELKHPILAKSINTLYLELLRDEKL